MSNTKRNTKRNTKQNTERDARIKPPSEDWIRLGHWTQLTPTLLWAHHGQIPGWAVDSQFDGVRQSMDAWYLESGSLTLRYERETEKYEAPCWVFPKRFPIRQLPSAGGNQLAIRFDLNWPDDSPLLVLDRTVHFPKGRFRAFDRASTGLVRFVEKRMAGSHLFVEERTAPLTGMAGFFTTFWTWIEAYISVLEHMKIPMSSRSTLDSRVAAAIDYLRRLPLTEPFREKDLAAHCSLSVAQLNRLFHQQVRYSPVQIRNNQRMSAACQALLYSKDTIKELAYSLGFNSPQHFAFWFRKRAGTGPREFRRSH